MPQTRNLNLERGTETGATENVDMQGGDIGGGGFDFDDGGFDSF